MITARVNVLERVLLKDKLDIFRNYMYEFALNENLNNLVKYFFSKQIMNNLRLYVFNQTEKLYIFLKISFITINEK